MKTTTQNLRVLRTLSKNQDIMTEEAPGLFSFSEILGFLSRTDQRIQQNPQLPEQFLKFWK